ncbi:MAG: hypothetical protein KIT68_11725 [Phycisphaeraceae bacterium]|nr:hypothetical protein [Phycisphaeraceae bacterium]
MLEHHGFIRYFPSAGEFDRGLIGLDIVRDRFNIDAHLGPRRVRPPDAPPLPNAPAGPGAPPAPDALLGPEAPLAPDALPMPGTHPTPIYLPAFAAALPLRPAA